jgi:DNA-binding FadR family transcriptional regulator
MAAQERTGFATEVLASIEEDIWNEVLLDLGQPQDR